MPLICTCVAVLKVKLKRASTWISITISKRFQEDLCSARGCSISEDR